MSAPLLKTVSQMYTNPVNNSSINIVLEEVCQHLDPRLSSYLVHYDFALGGFGHVDHLLHHVVGILVLHHGV